jgi:hypothetical protein
MQHPAQPHPSRPQNQATEHAKVKVTRRPVGTKLDGRSWEYKLLVKTRAELSAHVGSPSATQKALIDRAAWLSVYLAKQDARTEAGEFMSDHMSRQYLAWSNSLARTLKLLGLKSAAQQGPDLKAYLARHGESQAA